MATGKCNHISLELKNFDDRFAFTCNGCRDYGYGTCYTCLNLHCDYHLHKDCHLRQPSMSHPFFTQGKFMLKQNNNEPPQNLPCEACGMSLQGWRYALSIKGGSEISLHPCCMNLPCSKVANGATYTLTMRLESDTICCAHCRQTKGVKGWAYVLEKSNVAFHVKCIKEIKHQNWQRNYHLPLPNRMNTNNFRDVHQQRGLNPRRFRKRDLISFGVDLLLTVFGLGGSSVVLIMVELASNIW